MEDELHPDSVASAHASPGGIFLPSMVWTTDRQVAEGEKQRLLTWQASLRELVGNARTSDQNCTWHLMTEAALDQIDRDLDALYEWLEASERGVPLDADELA